MPPYKATEAVVGCRDWQARYTSRGEKTEKGKEPFSVRLTPDPELRQARLCCTRLSTSNQSGWARKTDFRVEFSFLLLCLHGCHFPSKQQPSFSLKGEVPETPLATSPGWLHLWCHLKILLLPWIRAQQMCEGRDQSQETRLPKHLRRHPSRSRCQAFIWCLRCALRCPSQQKSHSSFSPFLLQGNGWGGGKRAELSVKLSPQIYLPKPRFYYKENTHSHIHKIKNRRENYPGCKSPALWGDVPWKFSRACPMVEGVC